jgi:Histidine kinase-, DNA gyrase B-, and HSP90-like ATPase
MKEKMDLGGGIFNFFANYSVSWPKCFKELIDNSLDQNGNEIVIRIDSRRKNLSVSVEDNGGGCDDLRRMVSPGVHHRTDTTVAGQYGIGFTAAACWITQVGTATINTVKAGVRRQATINYRQMMEDGDTSFEVQQRPVASATGMKIHFPMCGKQLNDVNRLLDELSFFYAMRLQEGIRIEAIYNGESRILKPNLGPKLRDTIKVNGELYGKHFSGWFGIICDGEKASRHGMSVFWGHRLMQTTGDCCGQFNTARVYGVLNLGIEFQPNPLKDGLADEDEWNELMAAVYEQIKPVLEQADAEAEDFEWSSLCSDIEMDMNDAVKGRRESKDESDEGAVEPASSGKRHRKFSKTQSGGAAEALSKAGRWKIRVHHVAGNEVIVRHEIRNKELHIFVDKEHQWFSDCEPLRRRGRVESVICHEIARAASSDDYNKLPLLAMIHRAGNMNEDPVAVYMTAVAAQARGFANA